MSTQTSANVPVWTVGDRLSKARDWAGLTQAQMATELRIGRRSVVRYESSATPPRSVVLAYATVTKVPIEWLEGIYPDAMTVTDTYKSDLKSAA